MFLLVSSLALLVPPPASPDAPSSSSRLVDVLVQGDGAAAAVAAVGGRSLAALPIVDGLLARVPADQSPDLARQPEVRAVTDADRPLQVRAADPEPAPPVPDAGPQASPGAAGSSAAAGQGVGVGVLDTGISSSGDLAGRVVASADLSGEWSFTDSYGHGTFMAGLIAGSGQGGGPAGVAPGAGLIDLKVAGADGATTLGQVLAAMQLADAARDRFNLRVLNVSLGAPAEDPATAPLTEAAERLWADGITVVAAAGNDGGGVDAPGLDPYVLTVGSVDGAGQVPAWSSRGPDFAGRAKPDLVAPGVGLVGLRAPGSTIDQANPSARVGDRYFRGSGTSMSTAVVAGAAARVLAAHPGWGPDRVKAALTGTADPLGQGPAPAESGSGAGALDLAAALGQVPDRVANGDLFPLRAVGRPGTPPPAPSEPLDGLGWRAGGSDGLRWAPADGLPGPTAGAGDTEAWTAHPWLSGRWAVDGWSAKSWAAQQWLARVWAARQWSVAGLAPAAWAVLQWSWGGVLAATLDGGGLGGTGLGGLGGAVDWVARSWAARSWAERAWGSEDLAARSWAARSWADLAWAARSWAARSWAAVDWTARSWASRRWTAGTWAAAGWAPPPATARPAARSWARRKQ